MMQIKVIVEITNSKGHVETWSTVTDVRPTQQDQRALLADMQALVLNAVKPMEYVDGP